jgi:hypothetical protein
VDIISGVHGGIGAVAGSDVVVGWWRQNFLISWCSRVS